MIMKKVAAADKKFDGFRFLFSGKKNSSCKFEPLKLALFIVACCTVLSLAFSPVIHKEQPASSNSASRSRFVETTRIWQAGGLDRRYVSHLEVNWDRVSDMVNGTNLRIGLLNFNSSEVGFWRRTLPGAEVSPVGLEYAPASIDWEILYPEWIDEEGEYGEPSCPSFPLPRLEESKFDLVAVKLPCDRSGGRWSRDVARLHLQLAAARVAANSAEARVGVLIVSDCLPIPNLFKCGDLVEREGNLWLYEAETAALEEKLRLPVGSCELVVPFEAKVRPYTEFGRRREAYVTILHSSEQYVCGAIATAKSIRLSGSSRDLVALVDETIGEESRRGLAGAGWKVRTIRRIRNPKAKRDAYNEWNYSKFRLWQLADDYDKVVFLDADLLVLRNVDFLFSLPELSAVGNDATLFNSGVMVIEPSECTFRLLMDHVDEITSYNGGDQGYLNEIFTWWHRLPKNVNYLKHFAGEEQRRAKKERLFAAEQPAIYVAHYLGLKPWLCFRDYDCNWNVKNLRGFASNAAHGKWWRVHDALPESLRRFCLLPTKAKASLEYSRRQAEAEGFADGHWRRNITDPRLAVCSEAFCNWESMLAHWGKNTSPAAGGRNRTAALQSS